MFSQHKYYRCLQITYLNIGNYIWFIKKEKMYTFFNEINTLILKTAILEVKFNYEKMLIL